MPGESEHSLRVQLATALRERDEARHGLDEWCKAAMQERAEVKRLREALEKYGCHPPECAACPREDDSLCDCGLSAALATGGDRG